MVSIIVPVYNTEKYLRRCMDALVGQTISSDQIEFIVINDGSTDSSPRILEEYEKNYPGIVRVFNRSNGGQAAARNFGITKARGDYIGFADSDDYIDTTLYEKLYALAIKEDADMVECHYHSMLEQTTPDCSCGYKEIRTRGTIKEHESVRELFIDPQVSPWNKLYRKSIIVENNITFPEGIIYEDTSFYIKALPFIKKHAYLDEKLVYYCVRNGSTMTANKNRVTDIFKVFDDIVEFYLRKGLFKEYYKELEYFCVKIAFCSNFCRIGKVQNGYMRKEFFDKTFDFIIKNFPYYRKNDYFKGKTGIYIKSVNRFNCGIYAKILSETMVG